MVREEGERLVGTAEEFKKQWGRKRERQSENERGGRVGEHEGLTAWPRAPDTGCHLQINQQPELEPTNQKLLLHLLSSSPSENLTTWKSLSYQFFAFVSFFFSFLNF